MFIQRANCLQMSLYTRLRRQSTLLFVYKENSQHPLLFGENDSVGTPVAFAKFPKALPTPPRTYIEKGFNIQRWIEMKDGGHFAATEQPNLLARDIRDFFRELS